MMERGEVFYNKNYTNADTSFFHFRNSDFLSDRLQMTRNFVIIKSLFSSFFPVYQVVEKNFHIPQKKSSKKVFF